MPWYENPILMVPAGGILTAGVAWLLSWMGARKMRMERTDQIFMQDADLHSKQQSLEAELAALKTHGLIEQQKREEETLKRLDTLTTTQANMSLVLDESHAAINSSRTALETVLQGVRADLEATRLKMTNDAVSATERLQAVKDLHAAELHAKNIEIADLYRQNTALALATPAAAVVPVAVVLPPAEVPPVS